MGCHALVQGIFPTQGSKPCLLHCRQILYYLSHQASPPPQVYVGIANMLESAGTYGKGKRKAAIWRCISELSSFCGSKGKVIWNETPKGIWEETAREELSDLGASIDHHQAKVVRMVFLPQLLLFRFSHVLFLPASWSLSPQSCVSSSILVFSIKSR